MKKVIIVMMAVAVTLAGCMGQEANPVALYQPGDKELGCNALKVATNQVDKQIELKEYENVQKGGHNIMMFVGGFFLVVPWFFIDLKQSQEQELDALQQRRAHLVVLAAQRGCN